MAGAATRAWTGRAAVLAAPLVALGSPPAGAQTVAGTPIVNVASLHADGVGGTASNAVTMLVAERLDCTLARDDLQPSPTAIGVVLTNSGNGREAFAVAATGGTPRAIAVDDDGDGRFDPAHDHVLTDGTTPALAPGATLRLFVAIDGGASPAVTVSARAITGSGTPGTLLAGLGDGGSDAVIGPTGAAARLTIALAAETPPTIVETQAVLAGDGSTTPQTGAVVTYTLVARFTAASPAASLVDPIPANTGYLPASLTLDGAAIADAGRFVDGRVVVPLGAVEAGAVHRLSFKVVIQ